MEESVVLVNEDDTVIGTMEKMKAHRLGLLHRAFSIFLFDKQGNMLLQKRAREKYHSPNLWTNAVCSHPRENETYKDAAIRRLREELGIETLLTERFHFIYKAEVDGGLWEHELDYVFTGIYNGEFQLNPKEVSEVRYISMENLDKELKDHPEHFTEWFKIILGKSRDKINV
ncbi:isopentenyl-diphosphate Delta-isomerase [Riemerella columbipharyngis]|uniref:Isopentenyl-diphosphate delta-isomerase n=1 Tax=Riemerella columbipharyngis TaxID=1071918 RepID=A0A1G7DZB5_9FLAO|nr:isopentenyl-diphosphate Delta-isomerase [Riemerella columbipharyngis]SDE56818.1 isopentenyl-diphosphate delta-isomerase [Riemerella columbipharyngis]